MERSAPSREIGDRYVLQYAGGQERLALVQRGEEHPEALRPVESEHPLPPLSLLAAEWLIGPRDRMIRDGHGRYWCVGSRSLHGPAGHRWQIRFQRFTAEGDALHLTVETRHEPALLADSELVDILRHAWDPQDA